MLLEMQHLLIHVHIEVPRDRLVLLVETVPHAFERILDLLKLLVKLGLDNVVVAVEFVEVDSRFDHLLHPAEVRRVFLRRRISSRST